MAKESITESVLYQSSPFRTHPKEWSSCGTGTCLQLLDPGQPYLGCKHIQRLCIRALSGLGPSFSCCHPGSSPCCTTRRNTSCRHACSSRNASGGNRLWLLGLSRDACAKGTLIGTIEQIGHVSGCNLQQVLDLSSQIVIIFDKVTCHEIFHSTVWIIECCTHSCRDFVPGKAHLCDLQDVPGLFMQILSSAIESKSKAIASKALDADMQSEPSQVSSPLFAFASIWLLQQPSFVTYHS